MFIGCTVEVISEIEANKANQLINPDIKGPVFHIIVQCVFICLCFV